LNENSEKVLESEKTLKMIEEKKKRDLETVKRLSEKISTLEHQLDESEQKLTELNKLNEQMKDERNASAEEIKLLQESNEKLQKQVEELEADMIRKRIDNQTELQAMQVKKSGQTYHGHAKELSAVSAGHPQVSIKQSETTSPNDEFVPSSNSSLSSSFVVVEMDDQQASSNSGDNTPDSEQHSSSTADTNTKMKSESALEKTTSSNEVVTQSSESSIEVSRIRVSDERVQSVYEVPCLYCYCVPLYSLTV
jgi:hypothetical protein